MRTGFWLRLLKPCEPYLPEWGVGLSKSYCSVYWTCEMYDHCCGMTSRLPSNRF